MRRSQPGRTGADDRDLAFTGFAGQLGRQQRTADGKVSGVPVAFARTAFSQAILRVGPNRLDAELFGDVPLQGADGDGRVDTAATACVFTGSGADAAADGCKWIWRASDEVRVLVAAFSDQLNVAAGVGVNRAAHLTFDLGFPVREVGELDANSHSGLPHHSARAGRDLL